MIKNIGILTLSIFLLTSCSNNDSKTNKNSRLEADSLWTNVFPVIQGVWVMSDYIEEIKRTKSPYSSSKKLEGIVTMIIADERKGDSIFVGSSWNNHEGYSFYIKLENGKKPSSLKTNIVDYVNEDGYFELGYKISKKDTSIILYHYSSSNKLLDKRYFTKVIDSQTDNSADYGLDLIVNKNLFAGTYLAIDSNQHSSIVQFDVNGNTSGLSNYSTYYVLTDFIGPTLFDVICFQKDNGICYAFNIKNDTLKIYSIISTREDDVDEKIGELKYTLVRQK